jgi:cytochrome c5
MYGNMPLMSPEAKEAFSQYAQLYKDMRGDNKKAREEAKWMALMQAGFGIAGGTSPNALANINQGVQPAMAQYQSAIKDIRKDDREAVKGLIELGLTKEKFLQKTQELGINVYKANKVFEAAQVRANATIAAANATAEGKSLAKTQTLYTSEGSALKGREQIVGKEIFGSTDYLRHLNTLASVPKLPNNPTNQEKIKEAQDYINAAKELYANKMTPYVNRFKSAHSALHGDEGINFDVNQYLYPNGKPATPRVKFGNL